MKKILFCGLFALSAAHAGNFGPENLKGATPCFRVSSIQVSDELIAVLPGIKDAIFQKLSTRLTAYRIPFNSACISSSRYSLYVQVDAFKTSSNAWVYVVAVDIYDLLSHPGIASIWDAGTFGLDPNSGAALSATIVDATANQIDKFAANYATANP